MRITGLRCELSPAEAEAFSGSPYCIDNGSPCFSFALDGAGSDVSVRYYKILVSSSFGLLADNNGDMWDSGLIYSSDTSCIKYGGKPLSDKTTYYFRAFAMVGRTALKSRIGVFHTGILHAPVWRCGFIGAPGLTNEKLYFSREITIIKRLRHAYAYAAATAPYELSVNGKKLGKSEDGTGYVGFRYKFFDLTAALSDGANRITSCAGGAEERTGFIFHLDIEYEDGSAQIVVSDGKWLVSGSGGDSDGVPAEVFRPVSLTGAKPKAAPRTDPGNHPLFAPESFSLCRDIDLASYYAASLSDLLDLQRPDGSLPPGNNSGGVPEQGAAVLAFSYKHYMTFGNIKTLEDGYSGMQKLYGYVKNVTEQRDGPYGDPLGLAYGAVCAVYMKRISEALGQNGKAEYYGKEYGAICGELREALMAKDEPDSPRDCTCYALCAVYGMCEVSEKFAALIKRFGADAIESPLAFYHILSALCVTGRSDAAYRLLEESDRRDGYQPYRYEWMASYAAGINPAEAGYRSANITPRPDASLESFSLDYESISGIFGVKWNKTDNGFALTVTVPPNASATVSVPGRTLLRSEKQKPAASFECRSGTHTFSVI